MSTNKTFIDKFFDALGNIAKPSEKSVKRIEKRNETIKNISKKVSTKLSRLSRFRLVPPAYFFLFFFILALIMDYFDI